MAEFTLRLRRYDPESGEAPYWDEHTIDLEPHRSVLEGILQAKARFDGSIGIRCSCRAAICGSCGVRINGQPGLACHTHLEEAAKRAFGEGWNPPDEGQTTPVITVEPMGNMPVIKDLIVDMDAVHWKKIQRVTPWLINKEPIPEREYIVPHENMVDVTQSMACIQCGACVSDCLSMEVDPLFIGPAALAKAYRFVGDPRDAQQFERLKDLAEDPAGIYDCTHCFKCIEACPKGVASMNQIMRLRRRAGSDHHIEDRNNGERHERALTYLIRDYGLLHEAELLPRSYGGYSWFAKFKPAAGLELVDSLPSITKALLRRKVTPGGALRGHKIPRDDLKQVRRIYDTVEGHDDRYELNLYISGYDEEETGAETGPASAGTDGSGMSGAEAGQPGQSPEESPTR
ncbi:MAG TPA: succinate dehydrogenase/fumarate reductase iron-sulfur subunit [Gaiellaceae bacterium]|nr:succinate dehydrogenase/fumarate reductase iron-sulfur subunit [Gaiellaceae bacterium]